MPLITFGKTKVSGDTERRGFFQEPLNWIFIGATVAAGAGMWALSRKTENLTRQYRKELEQRMLEKKFGL